MVRVAPIFGLLLAACTLFPQVPIAYLGHGTYFDADGNPVEISAARVTATQAQLIADIEAVTTNLSNERSLIDQLVPDRTIADALYVDTLLDRADPEDEGRQQVVNNALRRWYVTEVLGEKIPVTGDWNKGVDGRDPA